MSGRRTQGKGKNSSEGTNWLAIGMAGAVAVGSLFAGAVAGYAASEAMNSSQEKERAQKGKTTSCPVSTSNHAVHSPGAIPTTSEHKPTPSTTDTAENECVICMEDMNTVAEVAFVPCGHCRCCETCAATLTQCPICRQSISGLHRIYRP